MEPIVTPPTAAEVTHDVRERPSVAWLAGPSLLVGALSTSLGAGASVRYRTAGRHALVLGGRGGAYFPGRYTGIPVFGTLGLELGYRGAFLSAGRTEVGAQALVAPQLAFGLAGEAAFVAPASLGAFFRYGPFEVELMGGGGPIVGQPGVSGVGLFGLSAGFVTGL